jgi:hypothetical protein
VGVEAVVTNFPFKTGGEMVAHALELVPVVIVLARLTFLESERRSNILDGGSLARVHVFRSRLPMMHRKGWTGPIASSAVSYAWFVWHRDHRGPTTLSRISWKADDRYDPLDDITKSVAVGFEAVRKRMRAGGPGWRSINHPQQGSFDLRPREIPDAIGPPNKRISE